jgi:glycosyltransferase involved in cell wall biosynthesis
MTNSQAVAARLHQLIVDSVDQLVADHLPDLRIPGSFAGHRVEPDVAADLAFTLGLLADGGVSEVASRTVDDAIAAVLAQVDGAGTHTFFSYRVAETLLRYGPFDDNDLIREWSVSARDNLARACDSSDWIPLLDQGLPRNYAAVLARCEAARRRLGLLDDPGPLTDLIERTRTMLARNAHHALDDSTHGIGRYDIYSADVWLFTEPLAEMLGGLWPRGVAAALALVESVGTRDGSAVVWGRSTGVLAAALTIELGALAIAGGHTDHPDRWLRRVDTATGAMSAWFERGLVNAHRHRSPYDYRGPFRRLQLTFDVLGKLAWAAGQLARVTPLEPAPAADAWPQHDRLIHFEEDRPAAVWAYRSPVIELTLPFVGATRSDYLAAPRTPGLFEVPVDSDIPCWVPLVHAKGKRWTAGGLPSEVHHDADGVVARWDGFARTGELDPSADARRLDGNCEARWRVDGRSVALDLVMTFRDRPDAVTIVVPETTRRPLVVESQDGRVDHIDVDGIKEWRSFWSTLSTVHQLDLEPSTRLSASIRVTPALRVASTAHGHHYDRSLYQPLGCRVVPRRSPVGPFADRRVGLDDIDLFHLHWPEWLAFDDAAEHQRIIATLAAARIPVVWTAHNLTPHDKQPETYDPIYQLWADAADAVIHHSHWGRSLMQGRYTFPDTTRHVVIEHGHFGDLWADHLPSRRQAEEMLELPPCRWRIGLVGAPRDEKRVTTFLEAFAATDRDDLQVVCWSLRPDERAPDDPRIAIAESYDMVDESRYATRLAACDLLALPFDPDGEMLATGLVGDVIGVGLGALASDWPYLTELLGGAGIPCGHTSTEIRAALEALTGEQVEAAKAASRARQPALSWERLATRTLELFESVVADAPARGRDQAMRSRSARSTG